VYSEPFFSIVIEDGTGGWRAHKPAIKEHLNSEWERMVLDGEVPDGMFERQSWLQRLAYKNVVSSQVPLISLRPQRGYDWGGLRNLTAHVRAASLGRF